MAYADRNQTGTRLATAIFVAGATALMMVGLVAALSFHFMKKTKHNTDVIDVPKEPDKPKDEPKPKKVDTPKPVDTPKVVIQKPIVQTPPVVTAQRVETVTEVKKPVEVVIPKEEPKKPPERHLATAAKQTGGEITDEDFPDSAKSRGESGTSTAHFTVGTDGRVASCNAAGASPSLDAEACKLILKRFRFKPALDDAGSPIVQEFTRRIKWQVQDQ